MNVNAIKTLLNMKLKRGNCYINMPTMKITNASYFFQLFRVLPKHFIHLSSHPCNH